MSARTTSDRDSKELYSDDDLFSIVSWGADLSFRELITMYHEGELSKPEYQRNYVWDKTVASRFIESLLMGLPVPGIFLAKVRSEEKLIIDGYQRIMTVYDYVQTGIFSKDNKVFKLSNSNAINKRWRGKAFTELTQEEQRRIKSGTIHAVIFEQKHPRDNDTSLYQVFERINTGGRSLTPQEIRNCVYQGKFNDLLIRLNHNPRWRELFGKDNPEPRMNDLEYILRFFTLSNRSIRFSKQKQISLKKELNICMSNTEANLEKYESNFVRMLDFVSNRFGKDAFFNVKKDGTVIERFHPTIYDGIAIATHLALENGKVNQFEDLRARKLLLLNDADFTRSTTERTTDVKNINDRINLALQFLYGVNNEQAKSL